MDRRQFASILAVAGLGTAAAPRFLYAAPSRYRLTGPFAYRNLALYFVHAPDHDRPAPRTLAEALEDGTARVYETQDVSRLEIENLGDQIVFVQAGDIVKGGQQDRVLTVSLVLPPRSGRVPIGAFCVEQGRWAKRGSEDAGRFASAKESIPSRDAKLALRGTGDEPIRRGASQTAQNAIWRDVSEMQEKYAAALGRPVTAPASRSSLQLTLENRELKSAAERYIAALTPIAEREIGDGASGFAFAVNGVLNSAEVYAAPALFAKLWPKLMRAAAVEALGENNGASDPPPPPAAETVLGFLATTESANERARTIDKHNHLITRATRNGVLFEARRETGAWVHRSYLAR